MDYIMLDTNIVIYLLYGEPWVIRWLETFENKTFAISIVSWIEVLAGSFKHKKTRLEIEAELSQFELLSLNQKIGSVAADIFENSYKKHGRLIKFQDGTIAATALAHNMPLITNNPKDFRRFKGLKIITPA